MIKRRFFDINLGGMISLAIFDVGNYNDTKISVYIALCIKEYFKVLKSKCSIERLKFKMSTS